MSLDAPFLMTALGLVAAALVARHRALRFGLELRNLHSLMRWIVVLSVFPLAWAMHRVGSALALEHTEIGVLDLVSTTALLGVVAVLWKGRFRAGTYICLAGLTYAPARVALDFATESAPSAPDAVSSLTLTQCGFAFATLLSLVLLVWMRWTMNHRTGVP